MLCKKHNLISGINPNDMTVPDYQALILPLLLVILNQHLCTVKAGTLKFICVTELEEKFQPEIIKPKL